MRKIFITLTVVFISAGFMLLSGNRAVPANKMTEKESQQKPGTDKGVGPFQNVTLAPVDKEKARSGMSLFTNKCAVCHELDIIKIGPPLRNSVKTYSPEFILNMIVNPVEMQKSNATVKELMKKYKNVPMLDLKTTQQEALKILEYLRSVSK
jgi:cytochrome c